MPNILIAASGTGGHIFPALAVADSLPNTWKISWLGVPDRLETQLIPEHYQLTTVVVGGLQGNFLNKFFQIYRFIVAIKSVIALFKERDIQIAFTTGGYIAAPVILAAKLYGIKVILHESNVFPGKVTRFMGRFCDLVAIGFPAADKFLPKCKTVCTGTPIRQLFRDLQPLPAWVPSGRGPLIVVIGGSQGSIGLNYMVRGVYKFLLAQGCRIVHLIGGNDLELTSISDKNLVVKQFTNDMPALLQHADLAISRAGAGIISELSICSTPAILVPFPFASDDHQTSNALYAAENGAAVIMHEGHDQEQTLIKILSRLLKSRLSDNCNGEDLLSYMRKGMKTIATSDSHLKLREIISHAL
tara:strand:+ start:51399 stop:52472 length:1074 start_codon:yes stop_codon:yes gene_type:complete